jgi:acyl-ACP thioesterase
VVDLGERRAVRLDPALRALPVGERAAPLPPPTPRPRLESSDEERRFRVRRSDIDSVGHVNHVRYVDWVVECVPDSVWDGCRIAGLEIVFSREVRRGQEVVSRARRLPGDEPRFAHELCDADGERLAAAVTAWSLTGR